MWHCKQCWDDPQHPVDCGEIPHCIRTLPERSKLYISPFKLDTNLGRTTGYNLESKYFVYRTLTGIIHTNPRNKRAIHLYSGSLGAFLQSSKDKVDEGHDLQHLV